MYPIKYGGVLDREKALGYKDTKDSKIIRGLWKEESEMKRARSDGIKGEPRPERLVLGSDSLSCSRCVEKWWGRTRCKWRVFGRLA